MLACWTVTLLGSVQHMFVAFWLVCGCRAVLILHGKGLQDTEEPLHVFSVLDQLSLLCLLSFYPFNF